GIAAELAVDLADGDACPVCGAIEHPHPAGAAEDAVGPEQVEAAETERRAAEAAHSRAEQEHALARQELTRLREAAGDHTPATAQVERARGAEARAAELETALTAFDEETARLSRAKEADALAAERERTELTAATTALETDRARIAEARGQDESVAARRRAHRA